MIYAKIEKKPLVTEIYGSHSKMLQETEPILFENPHDPVDRKTDEEVKAQVTQLLTAGTTTDQANFLKAVDHTHDDVKDLMKLGHKDEVNAIAHKLEHGKPTEKSQAKQALAKLAGSLAAKDGYEMKQVRKMLKQHYAHEERLLAKQLIKDASMEDFIKTFTVLAGVEQKFKIKGISFTDLLNNLQTSGTAALPQTRDTLSAWLDNTKSLHTIAMFTQLLYKWHNDTTNEVTTAPVSQPPAGGHPSA
jgi:hypothetical protein